MKQAQNKMNGYRIVVLTQGFVYVGSLEQTGDYYTLSNARNIRVWGTTKGLGQLAIDGPTDSTKLDDCGTVRFREESIAHVIDTDVKLWKS